MDYEIRGNYPYYTIWKEGVEDTRFACNTLEQAQACILDLRGAAFAKVQMADNDKAKAEA